MKRFVFQCTRCHTVLASVSLKGFTQVAKRHREKKHSKYKGRLTYRNTVIAPVQSTPRFVQ